MTRFPTTPFKKSVGEPDMGAGGGGGRERSWSGGGGVLSSIVIVIDEAKRVVAVYGNRLGCRAAPKRVLTLHEVSYAILHNAHKRTC